MKTRTDKDYVNESLLHGLQVLEALEGNRFEPVPTQRIADRTKLPYDKVRRCLLTLKLKGWAAQVPGGWTAGPRALGFSGRYSEVCLAAFVEAGAAKLLPDREEQFIAQGSES